MVPKAGLEPAQLSPPPPQDGVSTNSTTSAIHVLLFNHILIIFYFEDSGTGNTLFDCSAFKRILFLTCKLC